MFMAAGQANRVSEMDRNNGRTARFNLSSIWAHFHTKVLVIHMYRLALFNGHVFLNKAIKDTKALLCHPNNIYQQSTCRDTC